MLSIQEAYKALISLHCTDIHYCCLHMTNEKQGRIEEGEKK